MTTIQVPPSLPLCHFPLSCSPHFFSDRLSLSFCLLFFVPVTPLKTRNACRSLRGLRTGWGIESYPPFFFFLRHFLACPLGFVSQVAKIFFFPAHCAFFFQILRPCCSVGTILKPHRHKERACPGHWLDWQFQSVKKIHKSRSLGWSWSGGEVGEVGETVWHVCCPNP